MQTNLIASGTQFHIYLQWGQRLFSTVPTSAFTYETLLGVFSVIVKPMDRFTALITTNLVCRSRAVPSACAQLLWCRGLQGWKSSVARLSPWLGSLPASPPTAAAPQHYPCPGPALLQCGAGGVAVQISALMLIVVKSVISLKCLHPLVSHHGLVINQGAGTGDWVGKWSFWFDWTQPWLLVPAF